MNSGGITASRASAFASHQSMTNRENKTGGIAVISGIE